MEWQFSKFGGCCVKEDSSQIVRYSSTHDLPVSVDGKRYSSLSVSMCRVCVVRCSYPPSVLYCVCTGWCATETVRKFGDRPRPGSADVKCVTRGLRALDHHQRGLTVARRLCVSVCPSSSGIPPRYPRHPKAGVRKRPLRVKRDGHDLGRCQRMPSKVTG